MIVEQLPEVLALPTEQKEMLAEELLNQVVLEKEKIRPCWSCFGSGWRSTRRSRRAGWLGRPCATGC